MDNKWRETLATERRALADDYKGVSTTNKEELWLIYVTYLAFKKEESKISKDEFMTELGWLVPE